MGKPEVVYRDASFTLADAFAATDFCSLLQPAFPGLKLEWQSNALFSNTSDCSGELGVQPQPDDTVHNSFYVQARRSVTGGSTGIRLKLVTGPDEEEQKYSSEFDRAAELVLGHLFSSDKEKVMADIRAFKPFSLEIRGIKLKFFEEKITPGSFNLMLEPICGKHDCQITNAYYKLNLPVIELRQGDLNSDTAPQQE